MVWRAPAGLTFAVIAALALGAAAACGTNATGVTTCDTIELARCQRAIACGISLEPPYSTAGNDVDACIRFYRVACLHGLSGSDPGPVAAQACVADINASCPYAKMPETSPNCSFLIPPMTPVTDGAADALDGTTDGDASAADASSE
jgi:hypothetical protein